MKKVVLAALIFFFLSNSETILSAPMFFGPMTIRGTIELINWFPDEFVQGIEGMSGSAGIDRTVPAHYDITLINTTTSGNNIGMYEGDEEIVITLNHEFDNLSLEKGMEIIITNYRASGDEGYVSTSYDGIEIVDVSITSNNGNNQDDSFFHPTNIIRTEIFTLWDWAISSFFHLNDYYFSKNIPIYNSFLGQRYGNNNYFSYNPSGFDMQGSFVGIDSFKDYSSMGYNRSIPPVNFWQIEPFFTLSENNYLFIYSEFAFPQGYSNSYIPLDLII